jgi:hypothetical protein
MQPPIQPDRSLASIELKERVRILEARLADLQTRLPAHSIPPAMIAELDELDEQLAEARRQLDDVCPGGSSDT